MLKLNFEHHVVLIDTYSTTKLIGRLNFKHASIILRKPTYGFPFQI